MRLVKQNDDDGCGLACVAMVTGTSYGAVRRTYREVFRKKRTDEVGTTSLSKLKKIMRRHDIAIDGRMKRFAGRKPDELDLGFDALLKVNPRLDGDEWHWVLWDHRRHRVLDPKRPPYERLRYVGYWKLRRL